MIRWIFFFLAATLILPESTWAGDDDSGVGRYQVIPGALVPGTNGRPQEQALLLDSATGRTWILTPGAGKGPASRPLWVPMELRIRERVEVSTDSPKPATSPQPNRAKTPVGQRSNQRGYDYDDNP